MNQLSIVVIRSLPAFSALALAILVHGPVTCAKDTPQSKPTLEDVLLPAIKQHRGDVAVAVKHLKTGESYEYKADEAMPTASLIKFPIMIATYEKIDAGKLDPSMPIELTKQDQVAGSGVLSPHFSPGTRLSLRDAVRLMIALSDNTATNLVIDQIGIPEVNARMEALGCQETRLNSKVFRRDTSVDAERSKLYGLGSTSARDMVKLAELLYNKKLVSEKASAQMLEHMFACDDKLKVPRLLPPGTKVAHKTGSVSSSRTDAGIMETPGGPIAFCILTNNNQDQGWSDKNEGDLLCANIGLAAYQYFNASDGAAPAPVARVLQIGADGELVVALQRTLNARITPSPGIGTDGDFGPETEGAVKKFQTQAKLEPTGIVDAETWRALGPLIMEEQPAPEPAVVNAEPAEKEPMDTLDGPPYVTAKAWTIVDADSGELLAGEHEDEPREPASTTKIMTAYLVTSLAEKDTKVLNETITFTARADKTSGSTSDVREGEQLPVGELLYGLLLPSGNDAACALAEHFGSRFAEKKEGDGESPAPYDSFIAEMNRRAAEIGMKGTHFENPHGLPNEKHKTTARDLALLASLALKQPEFARRVATPQHGTTVDSMSGYRRNVVWRNTNQLLRREGYLGIKTGTTGAAGNCLVSCGERDGRRMIVVVLGATSTDSRYTDARNLYRWAWTHLVKPDGNTSRSRTVGRVSRDSPVQGSDNVAQPAVGLAGLEPPSGPNTDRAPIVLTDRARELHRRSLLVDGHNDMPWEIRKQGSSDFSKLDIAQLQPTLQTDIPRLRKGGVGAQFWSVWVPVELGYRGEALATTIEQIELVKLMIARYPDTFGLALSTDDVERVHGQGKIASLIGVEGGHCIEDSLSNLERLYKLGARYMTLTHTDSLSWADSSTDAARVGGLNAFGEEVVRKMNDLGMLVDLSHVSADTMRDALDVTKAPVIFSHSSARAICDHPRNVPDDVLQRLSEKDGVVMVNFFSGYVEPTAGQTTMAEMELERQLKKEHPDDPSFVDKQLKRWKAQHRYARGSIHDVLDHIDHVAKVAGVAHVGLGSDFDGVSVLPTQLEDVSYYPYITQGLIDRGYTDQQIQGILGGNLMRVFRSAEAHAARQKP